MAILVVEDDAQIAALVADGLGRAGFDTARESDGRAALARLTGAVWDAAVVDIMLPSLDGLALVESARAAGVTTPIIFLSARRELDDRLSGLSAGGDDYLVKPFAISELVARIEALLRRTRGASVPTQVATGRLALDRIAHTATVDGRTLLLQPREFALLDCLVRHAGKTVAKSALMSEVWDYNFDPATSVIETAVSRLRAKLAEAGLPDAIRTVRGLGYVYADA